MKQHFLGGDGNPHRSSVSGIGKCQLPVIQAGSQVQVLSLVEPGRCDLSKWM